MFSQAYVCPRGRGSAFGGRLHGGADPPPPPRRYMPRYGQPADGTHPTGMHSRLNIYVNQNWVWPIFRGLFDGDITKHGISLLPFMSLPRNDSQTHSCESVPGKLWKCINFFVCSLFWKPWHNTLLTPLMQWKWKKSEHFYDCKCLRNLPVPCKVIANGKTKYGRPTCSLFERNLYFVWKEYIFSSTELFLLSQNFRPNSSIFALHIINHSLIVIVQTKQM